MSTAHQWEDGLLGGLVALAVGALAVWVGFQMMRRPEFMTRRLMDKLGGNRLPSWLPLAAPGSFLWLKRAWGAFAMALGLIGIAAGVFLIGSGVRW